MRRTVRPFVREFKNRSSKPSARQPAPVANERETKPPLFDFSEVAPRRRVEHDDGYEAALKAADAVFGKKIDQAPPAPAPMDASLLPLPAGRVLPSLIETPDATADRPETEKKARKPRARAAEKAEPAEKPATPARRGRPPRQPKSESQSLQTRPAAKVVAEAPKTSAPRRTRRPIQLRWVLRTELKAGEKWKRRLPEAAR